MPLKTWKKLRQEYEIRNPWWVYRKDAVTLPSGNRGEYHFVHSLGSSMVIPILADARLLLVNQYRYLADRESLEFPCGAIKQGLTYDETARLELAEETGLVADDLQWVGSFNPYNGVTDEICRVYLARQLIPTNVPHDDSEEFEHLSLTIPEFDQKIRSGEVWDGMTLAAWALVSHLLK